MMCSVHKCGQPAVYRTVLPNEPIALMCLKHTELALDNPAWEPEMLVSVPERKRA